MYAYVLETGRGFFEGGARPNRSRSRILLPTPARNAKEPEPCQWGSGPK